jgi:hypothetical protein
VSLVQHTLFGEDSFRFGAMLGSSQVLELFLCGRPFNIGLNTFAFVDTKQVHHKSFLPRQDWYLLYCSLCSDKTST